MADESDWDALSADDKAARIEGFRAAVDAGMRTMANLEAFDEEAYRAWASRYYPRNLADQLTATITRPEPPRGDA